MWLKSTFLRWHILFILAVCLILTRNPLYFTSLINSDQLFYAEIYQKVFVEHESIHHFIFMASVYFIPILIYIGLRTFLSLQNAFLVGTIFQLYAYAFVFFLIVRQWVSDPRSLAVYYFTTLTGIVLLAFPHFWVMATFEVSLAYLQHFLATVLALLSFSLFLKILFSKERAIVLWLTLLPLVFFSSLSDTNYLIFFPIPALLVLGFFFRKEKQHSERKRLLILGSAILIAAGLGYLALKNLKYIGIDVNYDHLVFHVPLSEPALVRMFHVVMQGFSDLARANLFLLLLWIASVIYLIKMKRALKVLSTEEAKGPRACFIVYVLSIVFVSIVALFTVDPDVGPGGSNGMYFCTHIVAAIVLPIFFAVPDFLLRYFSARRKALLANSLFMVVLTLQALAFIFVPPVVGLKALVNSETNWPWLNCVNAAKEQYNLKAGMAVYWMARPIMLYAGIPMATVNHGFSPNDWLTSTDNFTLNDINFVAVDASIYSKAFNTVQESDVLQTYGPPSAIISCPTTMESFHIFSALKLLVYPKGIQLINTGA